MHNQDFEISNIGDPSVIQEFGTEIYFGKREYDSLLLFDYISITMIIYNVTVKVDSDIKDDWLQWMRDVHIPKVMDTGCFSDYDIMRLRYPKDDEGKTYAFQYYCADMDQLETYHREFAADLQREHSEKYGSHVAAFRTILERLDKKDVAK